MRFRSAEAAVLPLHLACRCILQLLVEIVAGRDWKKDPMCAGARSCASLHSDGLQHCPFKVAFSHGLRHCPCNRHICIAVCIRMGRNIAQVKASNLISSTLVLNLTFAFKCAATLGIQMGCNTSVCQSGLKRFAFLVWAETSPVPICSSRFAPLVWAETLPVNGLHRLACMFDVLVIYNIYRVLAQSSFWQPLQHGGNCSERPLWR